MCTHTHSLDTSVLFATRNTVSGASFSRSYYPTFGDQIYCSFPSYLHPSSVLSLLGSRSSVTERQWMKWRVRLAPWPLRFSPSGTPPVDPPPTPSTSITASPPSTRYNTQLILFPRLKAGFPYYSLIYFVLCGQRRSGESNILLRVFKWTKPQNSLIYHLLTPNSVLQAQILFI